MRRTLLTIGALALLGGSLRAGDDSMEKIGKETEKIYADARKVGKVDSKAIAELVDRAINLATDLKGEPGGFDAYEYAYQMIGNLEEAKQPTVFSEAVEGMIENYLDDDRMASITLGLLEGTPGPLAKKGLEYFEWIERDSKSDSVKCACAFSHLQKDAASAVTKADCAPLIKKFEELKAKYGAKPGPYGQGTWGEMLDESLDGLKVVGTPANEIDGKDLDGVAFKLSDYKGKVVLLDFWGYW